MRRRPSIGYLLTQVSDAVVKWRSSAPVLPPRVSQFAVRVSKGGITSWRSAAWPQRPRRIDAAEFQDGEQATEMPDFSHARSNALVMQRRPLMVASRERAGVPMRRNRAGIG